MRGTLCMQRVSYMLVRHTHTHMSSRTMYRERPFPGHVVLTNWATSAMCACVCLVSVGHETMCRDMCVCVCVTHL